MNGENVVGAIVGRNWGTIENCSNNGCKVNQISSNGSCFGGIVGANMKGASIKSCYNRGILNSLNDAGGIVGTNCGRIEDCFNYGNIVGTVQVGGIVAKQLADTTGNYTYYTKNCNNYGYVKGSYYVGGIVGYLETGEISRCRNNYIVESTGNDYATSTKYWSRTGGIVGYLKSGSGILECVNGENGSIKSAYGCVGGIAGFSNKNITSCYNLGEIKASDANGSTNVGGIVGKIDNGTVNYTYNMGKIDTVKGFIGGVAGQIASGTIKNSYNCGNITITAGTSYVAVENIGKANQYIGYILGYNNSGTCSTSVSNITTSTINGWTASDITSKLGSSFKKGTTYPVLSWE